MENQGFFIKEFALNYLVDLNLILEHDRHMLKQEHDATY